ncbi:nucleoside hydrolase [Pseudomonas sp. NPDC007930]|uniref:nucleoside hydrolase n=1 Tax=Pseudomonas sp. NPDC007930 TaxID=3364417 RepID=UPI0036E9FB9F
MIELIIDTDPGADDAVALLLAMASPEALRLHAITTVAGNVPVTTTSRNARLVRQWAGCEQIPVYAGAATPLRRAPVYATDVHGDQGMPGVAIEEPRAPLAGGDAVQYLVDTLLAAAPASITLALLGPQTNLALALARAPGIRRGIKQVVAMAGAHFNGGNITPVAEFNLFADPHAAEAVLASGVPLTYLPLDLTHTLLALPERLARLAALGNQAGARVEAIIRHYAQHDIARYGMAGGPVHDATVIAYLLAPELFSGRDLYLQVDAREGMGFGQSVADYHGVLGQPANVHWVERGDAEGFFELLAARLRRLA